MTRDEAAQAGDRTADDALYGIRFKTFVELDPEPDDAARSAFINALLKRVASVSEAIGIRTPITQAVLNTPE